MKHLMKLKLYIFCVVCFTQNILVANSPLWVGYQSSAMGRTPSLSGKIDKNFIAQFLPQDPIIVEAGAYDGLDTLEMSKLWPKAKIYAFEPMPQAYTDLQNKTSTCQNVIIFPIALSTNCGTQKFYLSNGASLGSSSLLAPDADMEKYHNDISFNETIDASCLTLDAWAKSNNINHVDFLWLDMQGMEPAMLESSPQILETVKVIYSEINLASIYKNSVLYPEYKQWLEIQGFELVREDLPWVDGGNALFVRKKVN